MRSAGSVSIAAGGALVNMGTLTFKTGSSLDIAKGDESYGSLVSSGTLNIQSGVTVTATGSGKVGFYDAGTGTIDSSQSTVIGQLAGASVVSAGADNGAGTAFTGGKETYYVTSATGAMGALNWSGKNMVIAAVATDNTTNAITLKSLTITSTGSYTSTTGAITATTLTVEEGGAITTGAATITIADGGALNNAGTITGASGAAIALGTTAAASLNNTGEIILTAADGTVTLGGNGTVTNAGTITNSSAAWTVNPFAGFDGTNKIFVNDGTIETITTTPAVQKALVTLPQSAGVNTGKIVLTGVGGAAIQSATLALTQNVEIGSGGKVISPTGAASPFSGGKTITIGTGGELALDNAVVAALTGVTVVNEGGTIALGAGVVGFDVASTYMGYGSGTVSSAATFTGASNLVVPANVNFSASGATTTAPFGTVTVYGAAEIGGTLEAVTAVTVGDFGSLTGSDMTLAAANTVTLGDGAVLSVTDAGATLRSRPIPPSPWARVPHSTSAPARLSSLPTRIKSPWRRTRPVVWW